jgi:hypothetical protein
VGSDVREREEFVGVNHLRDREVSDRRHDVELASWQVVSRAPSSSGVLLGP